MSTEPEIRHIEQELRAAGWAEQASLDRELRAWDRLSAEVNAYEATIDDYTNDVCSRDYIALFATNASVELRADIDTRVAAADERFRAATVRQAHQLKLGGWVRNLPDGRVEALIQGERTAVDRMLSWLLQGPPAARVTGVSHTETPTDRHYERFEQI